jgi:lysine biosynthesis protein LysW
LNRRLLDAFWIYCAEQKIDIHVKETAMSKAKCPMCGASVNVPAKAKEGDLVFCDACDAELEVVSTNPVELDWPLDDYEYDSEDVEYEYEDDDYDDYED